jgi:hypothetical protein
MASSTFLKPIACSARPGDRQGARDRAEAHDEVVVGDPVRLALLGRDLHGAVGVLDRGDLALEHVDALERLAVRGDHVARVDRARRRLREERLVGHVRARVHHDDGGLAVAEPAAQALRGVQPHGATAEDDDAGHLARLGHRGRSRVRHRKYGTAT